MLASISRKIVRIDKAYVKSIGEKDWYCENKSDMGVLLSTNKKKNTIRPGSALLMSLGACAADDVEIEINKKGYNVKGISAEITGVKKYDPLSRIDEIKLHFDVEADKEVPRELINEVAKHVVENVCPVANTITGDTKVIAKAIIRKSKK